MRSRCDSLFTISRSQMVHLNCLLILVYNKVQILYKLKLDKYEHFQWQLKEQFLYQQNLRSPHIMKQDNSDSLMLFEQNSTKIERSSPDFKKQVGHWTEQEHLVYLEFLMANKAKKAQSRKGQPQFKKMSELIGTRTPSQCRSHHQKFNPYNPSIKKNKSKNLFVIKEHTLPLLKSKQIMRKYFNARKESIDED